MSRSRRHGYTQEWRKDDQVIPIHPEREWPPAKAPLYGGDFVELRAHTCFSFSDGAMSAEALAHAATELGYTHLGITDTADLGGIARFANELRNDELRRLEPIVGAELVVDGHPVAFLARSAQGYRNLSALVTLARMGQWEHWKKAEQAKRRGRPKVTWAHVAEHAKDLHALTGPATGELASLVRAGKTSEAKRCVERWRELFPGTLAIEVQLHHTGGHEAALAAELIELANACEVPWVATQDPRYLDDRGRLVHDMLTALRYDVTLDEAAERGFLHPNGEWRLLSPREMIRRWEGREEGLRESVRIAEECAGFELGWMRPPMPDFRKAKLGAKMDDLEDLQALRSLAEAGAIERLGEVSQRHKDQIDRELALIGELGFAGFFLVMADAVRYARSKNILCQGRGSAANSVVAYCTGITPIDPVKHGLLFERFLSDARVDGQTEPPDIDVDFEHQRREEVLDYMYENYDRRHAAITAVTQLFHAPTAIQDAMRALGYEAEQAFAISKRLHRDEAGACVDDLPAIAERVGVDLGGWRGKTLLAALPGFDGLARLRSTHVGGFVLSSQLLGDFLPVEQTTMGRTIIQFDKDDLDYIGVPKFDFLGLGALSMVRIAFDVIEKETGTRPEMYGFDQEDAATYDLIQRGETIGTFQIESRAQINSILHTKPSRIYDIVVQVALIRPGPIQARFVHPYTERRLGREPVTYPHPSLAPILERTQGIPIFQEQAMAIAMALGGYTAAEADLLRRTMGNIRKKGKLEKALDGLKKAMLARITSGTAAGLSEEAATQICQDLESFANYGFPESHAWSFAMIAYVTAYLKVHHPTAFCIGLLNAQPMGFYPIATLINDAMRHGVKVRPPCLKVGEGDCTHEEGEMRMGWRFVRGIGSEALDALKAAREVAPFTSIADVVERSRLNRDDILALARAGAFGAWEADRRRAAWEALRACGDTLPLAPAPASTHDPAPMDRNQLVFLDYNTVGMSVYGHPMESVRAELAAKGAIDSRKLPEMRDGRLVSVVGLVTVRQRPSTAGGTIFLLLEDEWGYINVVVPQPLVAPNEEVVKRARFVKVQGRVENDGAAVSVVGRVFERLNVEGLEYQSHDFH